MALDGAASERLEVYNNLAGHLERGVLLCLSLHAIFLFMAKYGEVNLPLLLCLLGCSPHLTGFHGSFHHGFNNRHQVITASKSAKPTAYPAFTHGN